MPQVQYCQCVVPCELSRTTRSRPSINTVTITQAIKCSERLAKFHARQSKAEKKLYTLKGIGDKPWSIATSEKQLARLNEELPNAANDRQRKSLTERIE